MYSNTLSFLSKKWRHLDATTLRWILIGISFAVLFITLISIQMSRIYSSDDVVVQNIFQSWMAGRTHDAYIGTDNFIFKAPFYVLQDLAMPNSRAKLFIAVTIFNVVFLIGFIMITERLVRPYLRNKWALLGAYIPVIWFIGTYVYSQSVSILDQSKIATLANPNSRNLELGIAFILMIFVAMYLEGTLSFRQRWRKIALIIGAPILGFYFFSDPYFVYGLGGAVALTTGLLWFAKRITTIQTLRLVGYLSATLVFSQLIKLIVGHWGFHSVSNIPMQFASFENLGTNIAHGIYAFFIMFCADFWGGQVHAKTLVYMINAGALIFGVVGLIYACRRPTLLRPLNLLLISTFVVITGAYIFTVSGSDVGAWRYLILPALCLVLFTAQWFVQLVQSKKFNTRIVITLLSVCVFAILMNTALNIRIMAVAAKQPLVEQPNQNSVIVVNALKKYHLTKGYANYWVGPLNTYFANGSASVLPLVCNQNGQLAKFNWLINYPDFQVSSGRTFFLQDTTNPVHTCMDKGTETVFGPANQIIKVSDIYTLYVYDRDIAEPLPITSSGVTK